MKIDRNVISKKIGLILICISVIMTNHTISVFALDNPSISPYIMCVPDLGKCILSDVSQTKTIATVLYKQANSSWANDVTYSPENDNKVCGDPNNPHYCTIGEVGCVITSFAMITQTWRDTTTIEYTPKLINTTVKNGGTSTWEFAPGDFDNYFSSILQYDETLFADTTGRNGLKTVEQVLAEIKGPIDSNKLVILGGHYFTKNADGTYKEHPHFVVVYGYRIRTISYDDGTQEVIIYIYINDPGATRFYLSDFLTTYNQIHRIWSFRRS